MLHRGTIFNDNFNANTQKIDTCNMASADDFQRYIVAATYVLHNLEQVSRFYRFYRFFSRNDGALKIDPV